MNTQITPAMVREALVSTRSKNILDAPGWDHYFAKWADSLNSFIEAYRQRFGEVPDPIGLLSSSPAKGAAFWELDTLRLSVQMKIAVWRILSGLEIVAVNLEVEPERFHLSIRLGIWFGNSDEHYDSLNSEDIRLLRHFGTIEMGDKTRFQGYYAFA